MQIIDRSIEAVGSDSGPNLVRFVLASSMLFALAVSLPGSWSEPLNRVTASLSCACIALFGGHAQVAGDLISLDGFRVRIITECTSLYSVLLFAAFLLAVPAALNQRLAGLAAGATLLTCANTLRIAAVTVVGARRPALFEILHVYLG
jgi:exosortase H (IPTLxxWG-CTERM-specific)